MVRKLTSLLFFAILLSWSTVAWAVPPVCNVTGTVFKSSGAVAASTVVTFKSLYTQTIGADVVAPTTVTVTTDAAGALPAGTNLVRQLKINVTVGRDKPIGVTVPDSATTTFGELIGTVVSSTAVSSITIGAGGDYAMSATNPSSGFGVATLTPGQVTGIRGKTVTSTPPTNQQLLKFDTATDQILWAPGNKIEGNGALLDFTITNPVVLGASGDHFFNLKAFGAACSTTETTVSGTVSAGATAIPVANASSFLPGHGIEIGEAGAASSFTQPAAPTVTAVTLVRGEKFTNPNGTYTPKHTATENSFVSYQVSGASLRRVADVGAQAGTYTYTQSTGLYGFVTANLPGTLFGHLANYWTPVPAVPADWAATTTYIIGDIIKPSTNNAGNFLFKAAAVGCTSSAAVASWNQTLLGTTTDGQCTWTNVGLCKAETGCTFSYGNWTATTNYFEPQFLKPTVNNAGGFIFKLTSTGTSQSAAAAPAFSQTYLASTTDKNIKWTNIGAAATEYCYKYAWIGEDKHNSQASAQTCTSLGPATRDAENAVVALPTTTAPSDAIGIVWYVSTNGGSTWLEYWTSPILSFRAVPATSLIDEGTAIGRLFSISTGTNDVMAATQPLGAGGRPKSHYAKITSIVGNTLNIDSATLSDVTGTAVTHDDTKALEAGYAAVEASPNLGGVLQFPSSACRVRFINTASAPSVVGTNKPTSITLRGTTTPGGSNINLILTSSPGNSSANPNLAGLNIGVIGTLENLSVALAPANKHNGTLLTAIAPNGSSSFRTQVNRSYFSGRAMNARLFNLACCEPRIENSNLQAAVRHQIYTVGATGLYFDGNWLGFPFLYRHYIIDLEQSFNITIINNNFEEGPNYLRMGGSGSSQGDNKVFSNYFADTRSCNSSADVGPCNPIALGTIHGGTGALTGTAFEQNFVQFGAPSIVASGTGTRVIGNTITPTAAGPALVWQDNVAASKSANNRIATLGGGYFVDKSTSGQLDVGPDSFATQASYDFSESKSGGLFLYNTNDDGSTDKLITSPNIWRTMFKSGPSVAAVQTLADLNFYETKFANLGTPANGLVRYCPDCTVANPCAAGGTGALAKRLNGAWVCNDTAGASAAGTVLQGAASGASPAFTATPTLGVAGTTLGTLGLAGNTSGVATIRPAAAAGTFNFVLPITAGTSGQFLKSGGGGTTAMTWGAPEFSVSAGSNIFGNETSFPTNTVIATYKAANAGHFTQLSCVHESLAGGSCTTAPTVNVFEGTTNVGSTLTCSTTAQTKGNQSTTAQTLTFAADAIIGIFVSTQGATCTAPLFNVSATAVTP